MSVLLPRQHDALVVPSARSVLIIRVVREKERHVTGAMRSTGLLDSAYWASYWLQVQSLQMPMAKHYPKERNKPCYHEFAGIMDKLTSWDPIANPHKKYHRCIAPGPALAAILAGCEPAGGWEAASPEQIIAAAQLARTRIDQNLDGACGPVVLVYAGSSNGESLVSASNYPGGFECGHIWRAEVGHVADAGPILRELHGRIEDSICPAEAVARCVGGCRRPLPGGVQTATVAAARACPTRRRTLSAACCWPW